MWCPFVRIAVNFAVNFCKKSGEIHHIHRNQQIFYKNSPHFLQNCTRKPRPEIDSFIQRMSAQLLRVLSLKPPLAFGIIQLHLFRTDERLDIGTRSL